MQMILNRIEHHFAWVARAAPFRSMIGLALFPPDRGHLHPLRRVPLLPGTRRGGAFPGCQDEDR
jgi:hypothetical protein